MRVTVKFTKIGNNIKYRLPFRMWCTDTKRFIPNSGTYEKTDGIYKTWLGNAKAIDKLFKQTSVIFKKVELAQVYDPCDIPK